MGSRKTDETYGKALDLWQAPANAGDPLVCIATTYTFDATFFETECIGRFLQMSAHPSETASVAYLIEREEKLAGARVHALVDRRHARDKESLRWDVIGVIVPRATQHAKLAVLAWKDHVRLVIGSGNLTEPGYRKNVEVFGAVDISREEGGDKAALGSTLDFLEELAELGVGGDDPATPKARLLDSIRQVRQHVRSWPAVQDKTDPIPVFNGPTRSALRELEQHWPSGSPPREAYVVSPFFDHPPNDARALDAFSALLAKRGGTVSYFYVKTELLPDGRTRVYAPAQIGRPEGQKHDREVYSLTREQQGELREVHSKLLSLGNDDWRVLMIGSSNFTAAGLGVNERASNVEANLLYRLKTSDPAYPKLDRIWPDVDEDRLEPDSANLIWNPGFEEEEDGGDACPLPAAFKEALFHPAAEPALMLTLTDSLPAAWTIRVPAGRLLLSSTTAGAGVHTIPWTDATPPFVLEVTWQAADGATLAASWPVNATNVAALPPPEALRSLSLEELLEILASTRPLPAAVVDAIRKREKKKHADPSLDPLKRLDSQAFLLRRTKRVARALDRVRQRLEMPALTRDAYEWRLRGAVGPMTLADAFVREARLPGEAQFCLAELALSLRRVDPARPAQGGLSASVIRECIHTAIAEIESLASALPTTSETSMLDTYVREAFLEATAK
jgi:hypothetical protein